VFSTLNLRALGIARLGTPRGAEDGYFRLNRSDGTCSGIVIGGIGMSQWPAGLSGKFNVFSLST